MKSGKVYDAWTNETVLVPGERIDLNANLGSKKLALEGILEQIQAFLGNELTNTPLITSNLIAL
ncbi:MAG: hypothetical protein F6K11_09205 [Leptolyngbya sp. SIO3F4]|nr:hypothetical protein [Leptolyngbya sp. SIO3F4]